MATRILVTGATGFVGRALIHELQSQGFYDLVCVSRHPSSEFGVPQVALDIRRDTEWAEALKRVDVVVHCAGAVPSAETPESMMYEVNAAGTHQLALAAAGAGVRRFLFLSSVKVHGENSGVSGPLGPESPYAAHDAYARSKLEAEEALFRVAEDRGMEAVIIRPPLVYGPGVKGNFAQLMNAVVKGVPLPLGALDNQRSMVSVYNLVDFIMECITHPAAANESFLVSDGEDVSTPELLRLIGQACGRKARIFPVPIWVLKLLGRFTGKSEQVDRLVGDLQIDISKSHELLGWTPSVTMQQALKHTMGEI